MQKAKRSRGAAERVPDDSGLSQMRRAPETHRKHLLRLLRPRQKPLPAKQQHRLLTNYQLRSRPRTERIARRDIVGHDARASARLGTAIQRLGSAQPRNIGATRGSHQKRAPLSGKAHKQSIASRLRSLEKSLPFMFVYLHHKNGQRTTSALEGGINFALRDIPRRHRRHATCPPQGSHRALPPLQMRQKNNTF